MFQKQKQKVKERKKKKVAFRASNLKAVLHRNFVKKEKKRGQRVLGKNMHV